MMPESFILYMPQEWTWWQAGVMMMMMMMKLPCAFLRQDPKTHVYMCGLKGMESGFAECFQE